MKKTIAISLVLFAVISMAATAQAQETVNTRVDLRAQQDTNVEQRELPNQRSNETSNQRIELNNAIKVDRDAIREKMHTDNADIRVRLQNAQSPEERESVIQEAYERRQEYRNDNAELRDRRQVESRVIVSQKSDRIVERYDAVIQRVESILTRLESRIDALSSQGVDVTASEQATTDARVSLHNASVDFNQALDLYTNIDTTAMVQGDVKAVLSQSRELLQSAKAEIRSAWSSAREALTSLKATVRVETDVEVTS